MSLASTRLTIVTALASLLLSGCTSYPQETKTNYGPGKVDVVTREYVCYTDAQIIDGERTSVNLCGRSHSGFSFDYQPQIWAGIGNRMPAKFQLSDAIQGAKVRINDHFGFLKCDPLQQASGDAARETFCKLTLNDQVIVSAQVIFEPRSDTRMSEQPSGIFSLIDSLKRP